MDGIAAELRNAREALGLSLADVADTTLINVRFLEELDAGRCDFLPQTYVRAFLREYAATVGLSPEDILRRYEAARSAAADAPAPEAGALPAQAVAPAPALSPGPRPEGLQITPRVARWALLGAGLVAGGVILWNALSRDTGPAVREIPFDEVRAEHERAAGDTAAPPAPAGLRDSLTLTAAALDSVWLQIRVDEGPVRTLILRRGSRMSWRAADRFTLTLGNAGGAEFTLNDRPLGRLGRTGTVVRARELNRATLAEPGAAPAGAR